MPPRPFFSRRSITFFRELKLRVGTGVVAGSGVIGLGACVERDGAILWFLRASPKVDLNPESWFSSIFFDFVRFPIGGFLLFCGSPTRF